MKQRERSSFRVLDPSPKKPCLASSPPRDNNGNIFPAHVVSPPAADQASSSAHDLALSSPVDPPVEQENELYAIHRAFGLSLRPRK